ncbi:MAG: Hsp20/alpha crystallin family protein [Candidatus Korobacteraceae bacterium]
MSIARWDPFTELVPVQERMNRFLRDFLRDRDEGGNSQLAAPAFAPPIDIYEDQNHLVVEMEIPGMKEEDLNIQIDGNVLTVRGERKLEREEKGADFRRIERQYGVFQRSITLPASVDPNNADASYDNGVLRIQLPKREEAKARQIKVGESKTLSMSEKNKSNKESKDKAA